jgi:arylsulfatase A-like enzyme
MDKPNVLFICTDQQRADHAGFMGNPVVATPNLDALAATGMVFENAWVSNPVCMPNRSTMMTGRLPSAHGVVFNDRPLEWEANTYPRMLRAAGYRTALIGKSHLQHGMSADTAVPAPGAPVRADLRPPGWDHLEHAEHYRGEDVPEIDDFYGFDHVEFAIDHGARVSGHHLRWALAKGARLEDLDVPYGPEAPARHREGPWWQIYQPPYGEELHSTNFVAERSIAFIEEAAARGRPWLVKASFPDPHHPMTPPGRWFERHRPEDMELPATLDDPLDGAPAHLRRFQGFTPLGQRNWVAPCGATDPRIVRQALAATYGMIEMIDDAVGRILDTVDRLGLTGHTVVVFTSDHGDMMGDHGLLLKGFMHYRGTLQVPLVIRVPDRMPGRTAALASTLDLCPTILDLVGLAPFQGIQGTTLRPILADPAAVARDHVLIEDDLPSAELTGSFVPSRTRTLVTDRARYTRNSKGEEQLFDLEADRDEMIDLKGLDQDLHASMRVRMIDAMMAADDMAREAPTAP